MRLESAAARKPKGITGLPFLDKGSLKKKGEGVLREWCTRRGLDTNGTKTEMAERLLAYPYGIVKRGAFQL